MLPISRGYFLPFHSRHPTKWCIRLLGSSHTTFPVGNPVFRQPWAWCNSAIPLQYGLGVGDSGNVPVILQPGSPSRAPHYPKPAPLAPPPPLYNTASSCMLQAGHSWPQGLCVCYLLWEGNTFSGISHTSSGKPSLILQPDMVPPYWAPSSLRPTSVWCHQMFIPAAVLVMSARDFLGGPVAKTPCS